MLIIITALNFKHIIPTCQGVKTANTLVNTYMHSHNLNKYTTRAPFSHHRPKGYLKSHLINPIAQSSLSLNAQFMTKPQQYIITSINSTCVTIEHITEH